MCLYILLYEYNTMYFSTVRQTDLWFVFSLEQLQRMLLKTSLHMYSDAQIQTPDSLVYISRSGTVGKSVSWDNDKLFSQDMYMPTFFQQCMRVPIGPQPFLYLVLNFWLPGGSLMASHYGFSFAYSWLIIRLGIF